MDAGQRRPGDSSVDPMEIRPYCGGGTTDDERGETDRAYAEHKAEFVAAGGRGSKFDALNLMAAARLTAARILNGLSLDRGPQKRGATEQEVRGLLKALAGEATEASASGRLRLFRRRLWPSDDSPHR